MNEWIYVLIMAAVQGVTEFLPVSSSGHLAVLGGLFGLHESESLTRGIVLHGGSLAAIAVFYFYHINFITKIGNVFFKNNLHNSLAFKVISSSQLHMEGEPSGERA